MRSISSDSKVVQSSNISVEKCETKCLSSFMLCVNWRHGFDLVLVDIVKIIFWGISVELSANNKRRRRINVPVTNQQLSSITSILIRNTISVPRSCQRLLPDIEPNSLLLLLLPELLLVLLVVVTT